MAKNKAVNMVKIRLPVTRGDDAEVYVSINDESWLIKRGVTVEVPDYVAEVLERSQAQQDANLLKAEAHRI